jgi:hypothetical protein
MTPYQGTPYSQGYQTLPTTDLGYHTVTSTAAGITPQSHNLDLYGHQQTQGHDEIPTRPLSPRKQEYQDDYKVQYKHGKDRENEEIKGDNTVRKSQDNFNSERNAYSGIYDVLYLK